MTSTSHAAPGEHRDVQTIMSAGISLGILTVIGVVVFSLVSRSVGGRAGMLIEAALVILGGLAAAYLPARAIRPRTPEAIGWSALAGFLGAAVFTFADVAALGPAHIYSWRWYALGGGSGWWYIPVWWMGSALLAWIGAWAWAAAARAGREVNPGTLAAQTGVIGVVVTVALAASRSLHLGPAVAALAITLAVIIQLPVSLVTTRR